MRHTGHEHCAIASERPSTLDPRGPEGPEDRSPKGSGGSAKPNPKKEAKPKWAALRAAHKSFTVRERGGAKRSRAIIGPEGPGK